LGREKSGQRVPRDGTPKSFMVHLASLWVHRTLQRAPDCQLGIESFILPPILGQGVGQTDDLRELRKRVGLRTGRRIESASDRTVNSSARHC
jgi:hypothetical protein